MELVDSIGSKPMVLRDVWVRVPPPALVFSRKRVEGGDQTRHGGESAIWVAFSRVMVEECTHGPPGGVLTCGDWLVSSMELSRGHSFMSTGTATVPSITGLSAAVCTAYIAASSPS